MLYFRKMNRKLTAGIKCFCTTLLLAVFIFVNIPVDPVFSNYLLDRCLAPSSVFNKPTELESIELELLAAELDKNQTIQEVKTRLLELLLDPSRTKFDFLQDYALAQSKDGNTLYLAGKGRLITITCLHQEKQGRKVHFSLSSLTPVRYGFLSEQTDLVQVSYDPQSEALGGKIIGLLLARGVHLPEESRENLTAAIAFSFRVSGVSDKDHIKFDMDLKNLMMAAAILERVVEVFGGIKIPSGLAREIVLKFRSRPLEEFPSERKKIPSVRKDMRDSEKEAEIFRNIWSRLSHLINQPRPESTVAMVDDRKLNKFQRLDRALEISGFYENVERKWRESGKPKDDFVIVIKPNVMMSLLLEEDAIITDPTLVLHLIQRLMEKGFSKISVIEAQNVYGNWFKNRGVINVAGRVGYFDKDRIFPVNTPSYEAKVWVEGRERTFMIHDLSNDQVAEDPEQRHWVGRRLKEADYVIDFAKPKTHASALYTGFLKNYYGALPAQNKMRAYHNHLGIDEETIRQLQHHPVDFCIADFGIVADGWLGWKMRRIGKKPGMIMAGPDIISMEIVAGLKMGVDPFKNRFVAKAVERGFMVKPYEIVGGASLKPFRPWNKAPLWLSHFLAFVDRSYQFSNFLGFLFTGFVDRDEYQEFGMRDEKGKAAVFTWRPLSLILKVFLIFPITILALTNRDLLKDALNKVKDIFFVIRNRELLPASWKALKGVYIKNLFFRLLRYFTNLNYADSYDYLPLVRHLEPEDMFKLHDLIVRGRADLKQGTSDIRRYGSIIQVGRAQESFNSLSYLSVLAAYKILKGIEKGKWSAADILSDLRGRLSLKGVAIAKPAQFDWIASTRNLHQVIKLLKDWNAADSSLDRKMFLEALILNPFIDTEWIRQQERTDLLHQEEAVQLNKSLIERSWEQFKKNHPSLEVRIKGDDESPEIPGILKKIQEAWIGKIPLQRLILAQTQDGSWQITLVSRHLADESVLKHIERQINHVLSPDLAGHTLPGGIVLKDGQWEVFQGSAFAYGRLQGILEGKEMSSFLLRRELRELCEQGFSIQIGRNVPGSAFRRGKILFLDEKLFESVEDPVPAALLFVLVRREGARVSYHTAENILASIREMEAILSLDMRDEIRFQRWTRGRAGVEREEGLLRMKDNYQRDTDFFSTDILPDFTRRCLILEGFSEMKTGKFLEAVLKQVRSQSLHRLEVEETVMVSRGKRMIPKQVTLSRFMARDALTLMKQDTEFGRDIRLAERGHQEVFVVESGMVGQTTFIGVVGPEKDEDEIFFRECLMEILSDGKIWKQSLKSNILVDLREQTPKVYLKDLWHRDRKLETILAHYMENAKAHERKLRRFSALNDRYQEEARQIASFGNKAMGKTCFFNRAPQILVTGSRRGKEITRTLLVACPELIQKLSPVSIKISNRDVMIETALQDPASIEKLRRTIKELMKYYVISDLHLADLSRADNFYSPGKHRLLLSHIDKIIEERATLIINGDLFELWQAKASAILASYPEILERLRKVRRIVYVIGNHDESVPNHKLVEEIRAAMGNVEFKRYFVDVDAGLYFEHGNIPDPFNNETPVGHMIAWTLGWIERFVYKDAEMFFSRMKDRILSVNFSVKRDIVNYVERLVMLSEFLNAYARELNLPGREKLIGYGHTHIAYKPGIGPINDLLGSFAYALFGPAAVFEYLNSGAWVWREHRLMTSEGWMRKTDLKIWELPKFEGQDEKEVDISEFIEIFLPERVIRFFENEEPLSLGMKEIGSLPPSMAHEVRGTAGIFDQAA